MLHVITRYLLSFLLLTTSLIAGQVSHAQDDGPHYSRVKIDLTSTSIAQVAALGLEADHGVYAKGRHLINDFSSAEINALAEAGMTYEILIEDVQAFYIERSRQRLEHSHDHSHGKRAALSCEGADGGVQYDYETPSNYSFGSMAGYLTYTEMLAQLDLMVALYPDLISARQPIGSISTFEGRPIEWLRISDNPNTDEAQEPEVLFTSLHHAREPNSLSQTIFHMWYMLENYATDPEVQYLVDNTEMFFIPCVNPDGYVYNETINPDGGGLWRKNRFDNGDGTMGVDLNRNYDFNWGFDDDGSSPNTESETYRGTQGFSEPETQAVRDFCNARDIQISLHYHAFGNLLIYPWGFSDEPTPDSETFLGFTDVMTRENNFLAGTGSETVGYTVNGASDDWSYGEEITKPKIFSMTPEVGPGSFGFWPPPSAIDELNKSTMLQNLTAAHLLLTYGEAQEVGGSVLLTATEGTMTFSVKNFGLRAGELSISLSPVEPLVSITAQGASTFMMSHLDEETVTFDYALSSEVVSGEELQFVLSVDNGSHAWTQIISKQYAGQVTDLLADDASSMAIWNPSTSWGVTSDEFVSGPSSITDSPVGDYENDLERRLTIADPIDLSGVTQATLSFYAKWDIETDYDYVQVMASTHPVVDYQPLCGLFTDIGVADQDEGEPLYDGVQNNWVFEQIDLSDFIGEEAVYIRFSLVSDAFVTADGFYFDDLTVSTISDLSIGLEETPLSIAIAPYPNPFDEQLQMSLILDEYAVDVQLVLRDALGAVVLSEAIAPRASGKVNVILDTEAISQGVYLLEIQSKGLRQAAQRVVKY